MATKLLKLLIATILVALSTSTFAQKGLSMGQIRSTAPDLLHETLGTRIRRHAQWASAKSPFANLLSVW
jgi:hypothetical protein